jgi:hypothetical protein
VPLFAFVTPEWRLTYTTTTWQRQHVTPAWDKAFPEA